MEQLVDNMRSMKSSLALFHPELILVAGLVLVLVAGLFNARKHHLVMLTALVVAYTLTVTCRQFSTTEPGLLFGGMLRHDSFGTYLKILFNVAALFTVFMTWLNDKIQVRVSEYFVILIGTLLGAHLLTMSVHFIMVFISLELISIGSYVLAGFSFGRQSAEGSLKYFVFGSVASGIMLYGFTLLYGISGTLAFNGGEYALSAHSGSLLYIASIMALGGFLYKIAAAPLHPWSPDVYEAAPMPIVGYFSVVPKLAGIAVLVRFTQAVPVPVSSELMNWQSVLTAVAILSITVGNFAALWQRHPKRLMAYSSIAQAGFLLIGVVAIDYDGLRLAMFYATVYLAANFLVFMYLQYFESKGITTLESFSGLGRFSFAHSIFLLVGLITLTGLPPTAGFTAKLFVFSSLWETYASSGKSLTLLLLVFGLLNTVVSLFYYIRIPYYAFVRPGSGRMETKFLTFENLFGLVIVVVILGLFFNPGLLMGWINKINFAK